MLTPVNLSFHKFQLMSASSISTESVPTPIHFNVGDFLSAWTTIWLNLAAILDLFSLETYPVVFLEIGIHADLKLSREVKNQE